MTKPLPRLSISDLDMYAIERFLEETEQADLVDWQHAPAELAAHTWRTPTLAGIVLFGRNPQRSALCADQCGPYPRH